MENFDFKLNISSLDNCEDIIYEIEKNDFQNGSISWLFDKFLVIVVDNVLKNIQSFEINCTNGIIKSNKFLNFKNSMNFLESSYVYSYIKLFENEFNNFSSTKNILKILSKIYKFFIDNNTFVNNTNISSLVYHKPSLEIETGKFVFYKNLVKYNSNFKNIIEIYTFIFLNVIISENTFVYNSGERLIRNYLCSNQGHNIGRNTFILNTLSSCSIQTDGCFLPIIRLNIFANFLNFTKYQYELIVRTEYRLTKNSILNASYNFFNYKNPYEIIFDGHVNNLYPKVIISPSFADLSFKKLEYVNNSEFEFNFLNLKGKFIGDIEFNDTIIVQDKTIIEGNVLINNTNISIEFLQNSKLIIFGDLKIFGSPKNFMKIFSNDKTESKVLSVFYGSIILQYIHVENIIFHFEQNSNIKIQSVYSDKQDFSIEFNGIYENLIEINNLQTTSSIISINSFNLSIINSKFSKLLSYSIDFNEDLDKLTIEKDKYLREKIFNYNDLLVSEKNSSFFFFFPIGIDNNNYNFHLKVPTGYFVILPLNNLNKSNFNLMGKPDQLIRFHGLPLITFRREIFFRRKKNSIQSIQEHDIIWGYLKKTPSKKKKLNFVCL